MPQTAKRVFDQLSIRRVMNVLVAYRHLVELDSIRKGFFFEIFSQRRCDEIDFQTGNPGEMLQHDSIDGARSSAQRRKLVVEHEQPHHRTPDMRRKMYIGRLFASSKIRPTYSPMTPRVMS